MKKPHPYSRGKRKRGQDPGGNDIISDPSAGRPGGTSSQRGAGSRHGVQVRPNKIWCPSRAAQKSLGDLSRSVRHRLGVEAISAATLTANIGIHGSVRPGAIFELLMDLPGGKASFRALGRNSAAPRQEGKGFEAL